MYRAGQRTGRRTVGRAVGSGAGEPADATRADGESGDVIDAEVVEEEKK